MPQNNTSLWPGFQLDGRSDMVMSDQSVAMPNPKVQPLVDLLKAVATDQPNVRHSWQMSVVRVYYPLNPDAQAPGLSPRL